MYCIYTDTNVSPEDGNLDHIIPLSLGGRDQFTVWSSRSYNSLMGQAVEGAMVNDPLMQIIRSRARVRGHSSNDKPPAWTRAKIDDRPGQMAWTPDGLRLWDARAKRYVENDGERPIPVTVRLKPNMFTAARFAAKVALGGAYFIYGDAILRSVDCEVLRKLIALVPEEAQQDEYLANSGVHICDWIHPDSRTGVGAVYRALCEYTKRSIFIAVPHSNGITLSVGLLGNFVGTVILPGNCDELPIGIDKHDLGHVVVLGPGSMERMSYRQLATEFSLNGYGKELPIEKES